MNVGGMRPPLLLVLCISLIGVSTSLDIVKMQSSKIMWSRSSNNVDRFAVAIAIFACDAK